MSTPVFDATAGLDADLARLGVTGAAWSGALGTSAPSVTQMAAWPTGMVNLGYISDDGITEGRDENKEDFTPWQSLGPIRSEITSSVITFQMTFWQTSAEVLSLYYKVPLEEMNQSGVGLASIISFTDGVKRGQDRRAFGVDVLDAPYHRRIFAPNAEVSERGEVTYKSDTIIGYETTVTAYPGSDGVSLLRIFAEGFELPS